MFQSKEKTIGREQLLPFLCVLCTILLAAYNIRQSQQISTLSAVVQNQGEKIASLERICGAKRNRGNEDVFNRLEGKILSNKRNKFKVQRAAVSGENSEVSRIGKSSENKTVNISFNMKDVKGDQLSTEQKEPQLPTRDIRNRFVFEADNHHKIVKRSPGSKFGRYLDRRGKRRERCRKLCKGKRGRKGERGPQGPPGKSGPKGDQGPHGAMGSTGYPGPRGPIGPKGDIGSSGKSGPAGRHGLPGSKGEKGETGIKGDRGEDGRPGLKGEKGKDGSARTTELIHLVGNVDKRSSIIDLSGIASAKEARFTNWVVGEKHGLVSYSDGYIHIKVTGFYYVYCQIHYSGRISYNRHQVYKNNKDVLLLGFDTFNRGKSLFNSNASTKFVGGVFRLTENDSLTVRGAATQYTFMKDSAYFGVFLVQTLS